MEQHNFFPYDWNLINVDDDLDYTLIRSYGLNENNETVALIIRDFQPYIYLELPQYFRERHAVALRNLILEKSIKDHEPTSMKLVFKKKLYGAEFDANGNRKLFPFIHVTFKTPNDLKALNKMIRFTRHWPGLGNIKIKSHEDNAHPVLQLCCQYKIPVCGWISFQGIKKVKRKETRCELEFEVSCNNFKENLNIYTVPNPVIMAFDLEVNSSVRGSMPKTFRPGDEIFQISVIIGRQGSGKYKSYLLTLGDPDPKKFKSGVEIRPFKTEADLIIGYTKCIQEFQPNVISGYNIFEFDIDYLIHRAKFRSCYYEFAKQGLNIDGLDIEKSIEWWSGTFKNQKKDNKKNRKEFLYLHAEGRLFVDLLPVIRRDYKFYTYRLKEISTAFLGESKDPLNAEGIFKRYRVGMRGAKSNNPAMKAMGSLALSQVGIYCIQDSVLVFKLFEKIQTWIGLTEMARICNTQIFFLFTQGQQIKVFSQVYKKCMAENYIVEKDGFQAGENEAYTGAHVFEPIKGVHDFIVPLDFSSLYPSIIIAYNICWSTWVRDGSDIPDEDCHIFEWHDHFNCEHDTIKRSTKKKICEPRYYRFLKSPQGVLPELVKNLLDARNSVKGQIKESIKEKEKYPEKTDEIETKLIVLDKRQLALKIAANSSYGILGVHKGYLPFMPGAMCVTAKGRESIKKVSNIITTEYGLSRIYGDSVTGDTPLLLRNQKGDVLIRTIESLGKGSWNAYDGFKIDQSNRKEKQQAICDLEIWTVDKKTMQGQWSKIKRVIRHKTLKKLYRVNTPTGCVDVTEDHSLLDINCKKIKPTELKIGTKLLHSFPKEFIGTGYGNLEDNLLEPRSNPNSFEEIPDKILNSWKNIRKRFLKEYYIINSKRKWNKNSLKFHVKEKVVAQSIYYLLMSLGYNANIDLIDSKNSYQITTCKNYMKISSVTKILNLGETKENDFVYDIETESGTFLGGIGSMILKNTDSVYVKFPNLSDPTEIWNKSIEIAEKISTHFPPPMKLLFEMTIYKRFMILTKKRYMSIECNKDGIEKPEISKKGVMLARRDNSKVVRDIYAKIVMDIFNKVPEKEVLSNLDENIMKICRGEVQIEDFIITKRVSDIKDYKIRELPDDEEKRHKRLEDLECENEEEYKIKAIPAQAQLLLKMQSRGENVGAGTRLEYVVTTEGGHKAKQWKKIEDVHYFMRNSSILHIDYLYYIKNLSTQMDQVLLVVYGRKNYVKNIYKELVKIFTLREKLIEHLEKYLYKLEFKGKKSKYKIIKGRAKIVFSDE